MSKFTLFYKMPKGCNNPEHLISSEYGTRSLRSLETKKTFHHGVDLRLVKGTEISFKEDLFIEGFGENDTCGKYLAAWTSTDGSNIRVRVFICHLESILQNKGFVKAGTVVALTGNSGKYTTGAHLHFGLRDSVRGSHSRYNLSYEEARSAGFVDPMEHFTFEQIM